MEDLSTAFRFVGEESKLIRELVSESRVDHNVLAVNVLRHVVWLSDPIQMSFSMMNGLGITRPAQGYALETPGIDRV